MRSFEHRNKTERATLQIRHSDLRVLMKVEITCMTIELLFQLSRCRIMKKVSMLSWMHFEGGNIHMDWSDVRATPLPMTLSPLLLP